MALSRSQSQLSPAMYTTVHSMSTKKVHRYSWAADRLEQLGEQIIEPEKRDLVEVTDELLHNPPDNIKKMGEEIIDLNLLEINQLINLIQVLLGVSLPAQRWCVLAFIGHAILTAYFFYTETTAAIG